MSVPQPTPWGPVAAVLLCLLPTALLLSVTLIRRLSLPSSTSLPLAAALLAIIRLAYFSCPPQLVFASIVKGALEALTPLSVIYGAILLFETMQHTKCLPWMMQQVKSLSAGEPLAEVFLIGWAFAFMISGVGGFNTPIALAAPMLTSLGHDPIKSIISVVIFSTLASHYGSVGISIWFGFNSLGLSQADLLNIGLKASAMLSAISLVVGPIAASYLIGWRPVMSGGLFVVLSIVSAVVPMTLLAMVSTEFPVLLGGLSGIICTAALAYFRVGLRDKPATSVTAFPWLVDPPILTNLGINSQWQILKQKLPSFRLAAAAAAAAPQVVDGIMCISDVEMRTMPSPTEPCLNYLEDATIDSSSNSSSSNSSSSSSSASAMRLDECAPHPGTTSTTSDLASPFSKSSQNVNRGPETGDSNLARSSCPAAYSTCEVLLDNPPSRFIEPYRASGKDTAGSNMPLSCTLEPPAGQLHPARLGSQLATGPCSEYGSYNGVLHGHPHNENVTPSSNLVLSSSQSDMPTVACQPDSLAAALFAATIHHAALDGISRQPWSSGFRAAAGQRHAWQQRQQQQWQQQQQWHCRSRAPGFEQQGLDFSGTEIPAVDIGEGIEPSSDDIGLEDGSRCESSDCANHQDVEACCGSIKDQQQGASGTCTVDKGKWLKVAGRVVAKTLPLWLTLLLLLVTRVQQLKIQDMLQSTSPSLRVHLGSLGTFHLSAALVIRLQQLLSVPELDWQYEVLYVPCFLPFVVACLVTMVVHRRQLKKHEVRWTVPFNLAWEKLKCTIASMIGAMILSQLLSTGAVDSPAFIIGYYLSHWLGRGYLAIAGLLGALATFISGSTMTANITFGAIQQVAAVNMGVPVSTVLAVHVLGSCAGKMVCINNILSVKAMMDVQDMDDGKLMRRVIPVLTIFVVLAEAAGLVLGLSGVW